MPLSFYLKKSLAAVLLPPLMPLLVCIVGLLLLRRYPRAGRATLVGGIAIALFLSTPVTVRWLSSPLESAPAISAEALSKTQVIVILGGGQRRFAAEYDGSSPNGYSLERLRYGAKLAKQSGLPVLVTGGAPTGTTAEAVLMAQVLRNEFGIEVRWVESQSLDTQQNARLSAQLLREAGVNRIALVSHAMHLRRAQAEFRAQGLNVTPAPTVFLSAGPNGNEFFDWLPNNSSAQTAWFALHEWLGLAARRLQGLEID